MFLDQNWSNKYWTTLFHGQKGNNFFQWRWWGLDLLCVCAFLGFLVEKPESFFLDINLNTFFKFSTSCTTHPSIFFFKRFVLVTKDFDWPLVRKVQHKSSPFTIYFVSQTLQLNEIHFCKAWIHKHVSLSLRTSSTTASWPERALAWSIHLQNKSIAATYRYTCTFMLVEVYLCAGRSVLVEMYL